jgi:hypothetical protein
VQRKPEANKVDKPKKTDSKEKTKTTQTEQKALSK